MTDTPPRFEPMAYAQNLVARALIGLALLLPYAWRVPLLGWLMRHFVGPLAGYRTRARENLALIWPEMPQAERFAIADQALDNAGRSLIENYSTAEFTARQAEVMPTGPGLAALETARQTHRAVILVSGHFGNYEAARAALVVRGWQIGGLYRPMSNRYFNAHYVRTMEALSLIHI